MLTKDNNLFYLLCLCCMMSEVKQNKTKKKIGGTLDFQDDHCLTSVLIEVLSFNLLIISSLT